MTSPCVTTTSPDGTPGPCLEASERADLARSAALEVLGTARFAGLWFEDDGATLVLGYLGEQPSFEDIPGVDRMEERTMSLAELEELARVNNEAEGDSGYHWRIDVAAGNVYRIEAGRYLPDFGNEEFCDEVRSAIADGSLSWDALSADQVDEIGSRCAIGPPLD